ncbi:hypothetical protein ACNH6C_14720 [Bdellovibrio bacteriovorus]|uniref:hypothetical protein n=1 Tax=Bdellovibrio bacteriovorus TaxID=959 RepID=UPI003A811375
MGYSKYAFLGLVLLGQTVLANTSNIPTYMGALPEGTVITINQDLYIEPEEDGYVWKHILSESENHRFFLACRIDFEPFADTSQGLLLKAPIVIKFKDSYSSSGFNVVSNKKSIDNFWCMKSFVKRGASVDYRPTVNDLVKMLNLIGGSLVVPPPPQE